jgi:uncharacterized protein
MAKFFTPSKLSENIRETPEGFLFCLEVPIARTGYQTYGPGETPLEGDENGEVEMYRSPEEVFRPQTIASFQGKPITIQHPEDFVTPENWSVLSKGSVQNVRKGKEKDENGEECLVADLLITDAFAIELVKAGLREVSCGYDAEYEQAGKGRGRQVNITGNHLALVEQGRAGDFYAINDHKRKEEEMDKKFLDGLKKKFGAKAVDEAMAAGETVTDKDSMDELVKTMKDASEQWKTFGEMFERFEGFVKNLKAKDDDEEEEEKPKKKVAKEKEGEDAEGAEMEIMERVKALESAVAKLLEKMSGSTDEEEEEESEDEEEEEGSEDDDYDDDEEDPAMTGDSARAEILSPGVSKTAKKSELRKSALVGAYSTKDGKKVLLSLAGGTQGWANALKNKATMDTLFVAASEVLKHKRGTGLERTKDGTKFKVDDNGDSQPMTPEQINEFNAKHYAAKA